VALSRPIHYVIFDLDGVLLDTEPLYTTATAAVASRFGKTYDWSIKRACIGRGTRDAARIIIDGLGLPLSPDELIRERDRTLVGLLETVAAIPGAESFTRALASRGVSMAIATSTESELFARKAIPHRAWLSIFEGIVCGDDPRVLHSKPAPDIFLAAAQDLHADPTRCLVVEDSPFGVAAALDAGMQVIAMPDPAMDHAVYAGAHLIVAGFADLTPELLGV
jgi:pseudouridine-5'-monophosphatase